MGILETSTLSNGFDSICTYPAYVKKSCGQDGSCQMCM